MARNKDETLQLESRIDYEVASILSNSSALTKWPYIMRCLGMKEHDIEAVEKENPRRIRDQCTKVVHMWWISKGNAEDIDKIKEIISALKKENLIDAAQKLKVYRKKLQRSVQSQALLEEKETPSDKKLQHSEPPLPGYGIDERENSSPKKLPSSETNQTTVSSEKGREVWISGGWRPPGEPTAGIERLGVAGGEVSRLPSSLSLPWQVYGHCASLHAGARRLLVAGGWAVQGGERRCDRACMLDVLTGQSSHLPHLTTKRWRPCGFVLGDRMYVAAGEGPGGEEFNTVESICVSQPESAWQPAPSLPPHTGGHGMAACVSNKSVFLSGGEVSESCMITWQQGWPQWQERADMNTPRMYHAMACDGHDKVWVLGGYKEASMEEYDIHTDQWTYLPRLPHPRCATGAVFCAGRIILPGGLGPDDEDDDRNQKRSSVFVYDVREKIWSRSPLQLQTPVSDCAVTLV